MIDRIGKGRMMAATGSLKQIAYETIRHRILAGQYGPGELLNRRGVAADLAMSTAPVHEAMLQLERDGLMEALARVGTRVKTVSRQDLRDHLVVREALECQAARMICGAPLRAQLEHLERLADAVDAQDPLTPQTAEREVTFHCALVELAGCPGLLHEYQRIMRIGWFYRTNRLMTLLPDLPADLHRRHLHALAHAGPDAAADAVRRHIRNGKPTDLTPSEPLSHQSNLKGAS